MSSITNIDREESLAQCQFELYTKMHIGTKGIFKREAYEMPCEEASTFLQNIDFVPPFLRFEENLYKAHYMVRKLNIKDTNGDYSAEFLSPAMAAARIHHFVENRKFLPTLIEMQGG